jgi:hypothetical protein
MTTTAIANPRPLSRWQASGIHLLISAAIAAVALLLVLKVWYPPPLFTAEGGNELLFILIAVDVVLGPLITLVIFKSGKPGLRFDLAVIALLQTCALIYGLHVMFVARPVFITLVLDQFETVRANDLDPADVAQAKQKAFQSLPLAGPVFVAVDLPAKLDALKELMGEAQKSGKIVPHLPQYYVPYADQREKALAQSHPVESLRKREAAMTDQIEKQLAATGRKTAEVNFLPLQTRRGWGAVLIDAKTGDIVKVLPPPNL